MASKANLKGGGMIHETQWNAICAVVCSAKGTTTYGYQCGSGTVGADKFNALCALIGAPAAGFVTPGSGTVEAARYNALVDYVAANF